jgi:Na+/proline symporter
MPLFAVTAIEKLQTLKPEVWMKIGIAIVAVVAAVLIWRRVMKMNKVIAGVIVFVVCTIVFFNWVYYRKEPAFMTPIINKIAPFFPSAGDYSAKQGSQPKP